MYTQSKKCSGKQYSFCDPPDLPCKQGIGPSAFYFRVCYLYVAAFFCHLADKNKDKQTNKNVL